MFLTSWLRDEKSNRPRRHRTRLLFEHLEDRTVPNTYMPTIFDDGPLYSGSLRDAVLQANADPGVATDIIKLMPGLNGEAYELHINNINGHQENKAEKGDLDITSILHDLIIEGEGFSPVKGVLVPDPTKTIIDARSIDRAFQIFPTFKTVTFKNLTIKGGYARDDGVDGRPRDSSDALGGAILAQDCNLQLDHVIIDGNLAFAGSGAAGAPGSPGGDGFSALGGGVYMQDSPGLVGGVTLTFSQILDNTARGGDGGRGGDQLYEQIDTAPPASGNGGGAAGGGLYATLAQVTLTNSIIDHNDAEAGSGGNGSIGVDLGALGHFGRGGSGGLGGDSFGGGLYVSNDISIGVMVTLTTSTISSNEARGGLGGDGGGGDPDVVGGDGGSGGSAFGGGFFTSGNFSTTLTNSDLLTNKAVGGAGGHGSDTPNSAILLKGGAGGGPGGDARGGGLYAFNPGLLIIDGGQVKDNVAEGEVGGDGGDGGGGTNLEVGGTGGDGGDGGRAQGGGLYVLAETGFNPVTISTASFSNNHAEGGPAGDAGAGGFGTEVGGTGGDGGNGGSAQGGGLFFVLAPNTSAHLTGSPIHHNRAEGSVGGAGGNGLNLSDEIGGDGGAAGAGGSAYGGGLFVLGGSLTLSDVPITSNDAFGSAGNKGGDGGSGSTGGDGGAGGAGGAGQGGGLYADGGSVTLDNSTISANKAEGGIAGAGGDGGDATDETGGTGGGGGSGGAGQGGGVFANSANSATIDITQSTIDNNQATGGQGGKGGQGGQASDSTGGNGGNGGVGGAGQGGGLASLGGTITLTNSTVSTNIARGGQGGKGGKGGDNLDNVNDGGKGGNGGNGGAVQGGGIFLDGGTLTLFSDTIASNKARPSTGGKRGKGGSGGNDGSPGSGHLGAGGGVFNLDATVFAYNTLIASNTAGVAYDFSGLLSTAINNLLGTGDGAILPANAQGNIVGSIASPIDPKLGPLANNGGPTKTHALLVGSPAINTGENAYAPGPTDQRGGIFDRIVGPYIDIGAYEFKSRDKPGVGPGKPGLPKVMSTTSSPLSVWTLEFNMAEKSFREIIETICPPQELNHHITKKLEESGFGFCLVNLPITVTPILSCSSLRLGPMRPSFIVTFFG